MAISFTMNLNSDSIISPTSKNMNPHKLSYEEVRAIMKICRELVLYSQPLQVFNSIQQYFEVKRHKPVADFILRLKALPAEIKASISSALSTGQIDSKLWLIKKVAETIGWNDKKVFILGGWFGILPFLVHLTNLTDKSKFRSVDIDKDVARWAAFLNEWNPDFTSIHADMHNLNYQNTHFYVHAHPPYEIQESADIIVNTSCEHLSKFNDWYGLIPKGKWLVLQSNNFFDCSEHVNCVEDLSLFKKQAPMSDYVYEGFLPLQKYNRFMLIGKK